MKIKKLVVTVAALGAMTLSATSQAAIYRWSFSDVNQADFAFLDYDTSLSKFRLFDNPANNYLSGNLGVNGVAFDFVGAQTLPNTSATFTDADSNVAIGTFITNNTIPSLPSGFVRGYSTLSNASAFEINNGESTSFSLGSIDIANIDNVAVRLNSGGVLQPLNGQWVVGTSVNNGAPVPEAETSAMMAFGLGVLGFVARRRKKA